jgi:hypothetical protein
MSEKKNNISDGISVQSHQIQLSSIPSLSTTDNIKTAPDFRLHFDERMAA